MSKSTSTGTAQTLAQCLGQIESEGYAIAEGAIDATQITQIKSELAPYLQQKKMGRNDFEGFHSERVYALLAKAPSIATLIEHSTVLALVDELLPKNYLLSAALAINVHPGETPQNFHIDDAAGNAPWQKPRPMFGVSTIWALDDFTPTNGATQIVPGSHRWDDNRTATDLDAVDVVMPAGSVLMFAGNLVHRGGANRSNTTRLGITPQYCAPWLRQLENMVLAVPQEKAATYSDRIQSLLGYNVIDPGFMGYVDGMHPKRLLNPSYQGRRIRGDLPP